MTTGRSKSPEVNSSSMADIAFLLLTFFLLTTTILDQKGILMMLPVYQTDPLVTDVHDRNIFAIQINSYDQLLVEGATRANAEGLRSEIMAFVLNTENDPTLSESPLKAIVSIKSDRGTSHQAFITVLDEAHAAYYEIYAGRAGVTAEVFRNLDTTNPAQRRLYEIGREGVPMNISIAEPTAIR